MLPEAMQDEPVLQAIESRFPAAILEADKPLDQLVIFIDPASLLGVGTLLKDEFGFQQLSGVTAVDWWPVQPRFEVVYLLHSFNKNSRIRVKMRVAEGQEIESVTPLWRSANWYEREVFDLFGIPFINHPNLERIMMPEDWEGHPLRKDYPVHGYKYSYSEEA